jgi:hypothetical protein
VLGKELDDGGDDSIPSKQNKSASDLRFCASHDVAAPIVKSNLAAIKKVHSTSCQNKLNDTTTQQTGLINAGQSAKIIWRICFESHNLRCSTAS